MLAAAICPKWNKSYKTKDIFSHSPFVNCHSIFEYIAATEQKITFKTSSIVDLQLQLSSTLHY